MLSTVRLHLCLHSFAYDVYIYHRLSRCYILVTNTLFAIFGAALIAFGVLGAQHRIESSILIPVNILKSKLIANECLRVIMLF